MRKSALLLLAALAVGCGPSYGAQGVKSPEEILDEQLEEDEKNAANQTDTGGPTEETDMDKRAKWDKHQSELELIRAARSAKSCVGVVTSEGPQGTAKVTLTFSPDGNVKASDINSPFKDTPLGKCILNAMANVVVPPFSGDDHIVDWDIDLDAKDEGGEGE
ncbi:MAG: hypothetical protein H6718_06355 [Polyangiaceae bacterium]|nr:hypothetical protein [Myxococcales bacterium]MCB9585000.1 hypothetical protein [Polyangiaceae bacterium]MCB9607427.1 hypothetical protein [Polyangiaceae bacterium]